MGSRGSASWVVLAHDPMCEFFMGFDKDVSCSGA